MYKRGAEENNRVSADITYFVNVNVYNRCIDYNLKNHFYNILIFIY